MENVNYAVPAIAKDIGKKKRANRNAKLKQCKLDAKREQWLSQVKMNESKCENISASPTSPFQHTSENKPTKRERSRQPASTPLELEHEKTIKQETSNSDSPKQNDNIPLKNGINNDNTISSSSSSSSSGSSTGSYSRSVSDDEEEEDGSDENEGDGLDDWETIADALSMSSNNDHESKLVNDNLCPAVEKKSEPTKHEPELTAPRAWRPDDVFRPQSLPNLSKHMSFPLERRFEAHLKLHGVPSSCPICYEDLDLTDSSFLPCECGFHICLFCHKRILEDDARCPGCRKLYNSKPAGEEIGIVTGVGGPSLVYRISRSCSMNTRS